MYHVLYMYQGLQLSCSACQQETSAAAMQLKAGTLDPWLHHELSYDFSLHIHAILCCTLHYPQHHSTFHELVSFVCCFLCLEAPPQAVTPRIQCIHNSSDTSSAGRILLIGVLSWSTCPAVAELADSVAAAAGVP